MYPLSFKIFTRFVILGLNFWYVGPPKPILKGYDPVRRLPIDKIVDAAEQIACSKYTPFCIRLSIVGVIDDFFAPKHLSERN